MPKKIFELAKEQNIGALELVEKLREMGFSVRNHMSSLSDEEISKYQEMLFESTNAKSKKKATKKKVTKKKVTKKSTSAVTESSDAIHTSEADEKNSKKVVTVKRKKEVKEEPLLKAEEDTSQSKLIEEAREDLPSPLPVTAPSVAAEKHEISSVHDVFKELSAVAASQKAKEEEALAKEAESMAVAEKKEEIEKTQTILRKERDKTDTPARGLRVVYRPPPEAKKPVLEKAEEVISDSVSETGLEAKSE